jgi:hypothetical protein
LIPITVFFLNPSSFAYLIEQLIKPVMQILIKEEILVLVFTFKLTFSNLFVLDIRQRRRRQLDTVDYIR